MRTLTRSVPTVPPLRLPRAHVSTAAAVSAGRWGLVASGVALPYVLAHV